MTATKVRYYVNGRRRGDTLNKFGNIAYFTTKGIDGKERLSTVELKKLLAHLGVADHTAYPWEVTLPNGVVLAAKADRALPGTTPRKATKKAAKKRAPAKARKAPAKRTTKKVAAKRSTSSSQRAKAGVKPLPKKATRKVS